MTNRHGLRNDLLLGNPLRVCGNLLHPISKMMVCSAQCEMKMKRPRFLKLILVTKKFTFSSTAQGTRAWFLKVSHEESV